MRLDLSVLIVNWNSKKFVRECLKSLKATCKGLSLQVIVVDSGSFDGCGEMLSNEFPEVEFVQCPRNLGFAHGNNLGFQYVKGKRLLLLNPDTNVLPGAIERLLVELERHPDSGIVAPKLLNSNGSLQTSCVQALPTPVNQALDSELLRRLLPRATIWGTWHAFNAAEPTEVEAVSGACMMLRTETFERLGGFVEEFFMYGEDMDLCVRVRDQNLKVLYVPDIAVVHYGGGSSVGLGSRFSTVMMRQALTIFLRRNRGKMAAFSYRTLQGVSGVIRIIVSLLCIVVKGANAPSASLSVRKWLWIVGWATGFRTNGNNSRTPSEPGKMALQNQEKEPTTFNGICE